MLAVQGLVTVGIVIFLGQFVSEEITNSMCNEMTDFESGSRNADGCSFLANGG